MTIPEVGDSSVPTARVEAERGFSWAWLLPLLALAFAVYLVVETWGGRGPLVTVRAREGYGLQAGDPLRYRGIQVGEIEAVGLDPDLASVALSVRLSPAAAGLAREGSRFWLVRPQLSLEGVQGLETIIGANYLAVLPGPPGGEPRSEFAALEDAPIRESIEPGGLRILLEAPQRYALAPGAEISFRGFQVGTVLSVSLSSDATAVEIEAYIRADYAGLVRQDTRFWEVGGVEADFGITGGLQLDVGSLRSLLVGGIAMATPTSPGAAAEPGHRFRLHADPEEEWLEWRPALPVGAAVPLGNGELPKLVRAELAWKSGRIFARRKTRSGWLLSVEGGVVGPADLLRPVDAAREGTQLALDGEVREIVEEPELAGALARAPIPLSSPAAWPVGRVDFAAAAGDWLAVADPSIAPLPISAARLAPVDDGWEIRETPAFDATWHGAAVIERESALLVGVLLVDGESSRIVRPPAAFWPSDPDR